MGQRGGPARAALTPGELLCPFSLAHAAAKVRWDSGGDETPFPSNTCHALPRWSANHEAFCSRETAVSPLMLLISSPSHPWYSLEKETKEERNLISTITLLVGPQAPCSPASCPSARGPSTGTLPPGVSSPIFLPGLQTLTVSPPPLRMSSPFAVYLQCSLAYSYLHMENTDTK